MKRRLSASNDDDVLPSSSRRKRVRYDSLERTLAHMTLGSAVATTPEDVDMWPKTSPPRPRMQEAMNVVFPSSVEEPPTTPASEPVEMDVVTTDTLESGKLEIKDVQISSAVLERIKRQTKCPPPLIPLPCQTSQALVLYRVPRPSSSNDQPEEQPTRTSILVAQEDDVMEVE